MSPRLITYVALAGDEKISTLALDSRTGVFVVVREIKLSGGPGPLALSPDGRRLYAAIRSTNEMSSFEVDPANGQINHLGTIDLHSDPCSISTDRAGRFLLSAYYEAGGIAVHAIDETGAILPDPVMRRQTMHKAHCVQVDVTNRFTFLPHVGESNTIFQFCLIPNLADCRTTNPCGSNSRTVLDPGTTVTTPMEDSFISTTSRARASRHTSSIRPQGL